jgi:hypothetical protein
MSRIPIIPYQKTQDGSLQRFAFSSTGEIVDLINFIAYTNEELKNFTPRIINDKDTVNTALKTIDGAIRVINRDKANIVDLATVATSGNYSDIINKPNIPINVSDLNNDEGYLKATDKINSAVNADNATKDSANQIINSTYIKSLTVNGNTITITKGDNTTSTVTIQNAAYDSGTTAQLNTGTDTTDKAWAPKQISDYVISKINSVETGVMSINTGNTNGTISVNTNGVLSSVPIAGLESGAFVEAYEHPTIAGYKHIPSGGSADQVLKYSADGTATWATLTASDVGALASNGTAVKATADASGNTITTTYATKTEVSAIPKFKIEVVPSLPATGEVATVYLVTTGSETNNLYTEYIYVNNTWEKLGTQAVDLTDYVLKSDITSGANNGAIAVDGVDIPVTGLSTVATTGNYNDLLNIPTNIATLDGDQELVGVKTFLGTKAIHFKQSTKNDKLGFTLYSNTDVERGYLEFNPTNTTDGITGLLSLGNYATTAAGISQVGFRRYSSVKNAAGAYNLLMPLIADARVPFNLTTNYTNFYLLLGVTDGNNMILVNKNGVLDLSSLLPTVPTNVSSFINDAGYLDSVDWSDVGNKPNVFAPDTHNHSTSDITSLNGYAIASTAGAIAATDTLNEALGKLQKSIDNLNEALTRLQNSINSNQNE